MAEPLITQRLWPGEIGSERLSHGQTGGWLDLCCNLSSTTNRENHAKLQAQK
jgi:hypothetical protein